MVDDSAEFAVEEGQEGIVLLQNLVENLGIFFTEYAVLELRVSNGLTRDGGVVIIALDSIETLWMLNDKIEPYIGLDLAKDVRVRARRDALNWRLSLREWLEKVNDTLADSYLLALLVYAH